MTQKHRNARSSEYATRSDFCRIYLEQTNSLYLLSLLLTADSRKAEQCFLSGFEESINNNFVFKERAQLWACRSVILQAIRLLRPRPNDEKESHEARVSPWNLQALAGVRAYPKLARIVGLDSFQRFVFIMSILEKYSDQDCSVLLGCYRRDVIHARAAAVRHLAGVVGAPEMQPISDSTPKSSLAEAGI